MQSKQIIKYWSMQLFKAQIHYLRHALLQEGISPLPEKPDASCRSDNVTKMPCTTVPPV